jgi:hypothetical protein
MIRWLALATPFVASVAFAQTESLPPLPAPTSPEPPLSTGPVPAPAVSDATNNTPAPPATSASPAAPPQPAVSAAPRADVHERGAYLHDGLYLRMALGASYGWVSGEGPSGPAHLSGGGPAIMLAIGGTPAPGLVIAFDFSIASVDGDFAGAPPGAAGPASTVEPLVGALLDWYPWPDGGWHLGGALGLGGLGLTDSAGFNSNGYSFGVAALGGYDWWISTQWSAGVLAFVATATTTGTEDNNQNQTGYRFTPATIGIEASLLFH